MKMEGTIEYNDGPLEDIKHAYVVQQDNLLRTSDCLQWAETSGAHGAGDLTVRTVRRELM